MIDKPDQRDGEQGLTTMTKIPTPKSAPTAPRRAWVKPRIDKLDAGQAEVGTRASADGAFSTS